MAAGTMQTMTMSDGAAIGVYHVQPMGERRGGLVVVQEIFGVTDHIKAVADDYAAHGYEVLAPGLYDREEPGFAVGYDEEGMKRAFAMMQKHPMDRSVADVQACVDALKDAGPVFVVGYCYGGSVAWFAATRMTGVAASSGYYGSAPAQGAGAEEPKVPIQMHFGRFDDHIGMDGVEALIAKDWPQAEVFVYDAGHGFNSDRRDAYDQASAELAKARTLQLFRANGG